MIDRRNVIRAVLACAALLAAAGPATASASELPAVTLTLRDGRFEPEPLEGPARTKFKIVLHNAGTGPAEFESESLRLEKVLSAGARSFVVVQPRPPGTYDMFDEFHPRAPRGRIVLK